MVGTTPGVGPHGGPDIAVFLSSTYEDLKKHRKAVIRAIHKMGDRVVAMEYWSADSVAADTSSVERLRRCDVVVLLVAHRYGSVPEGEAYSVTELEYRAARAAAIPVLAFFVDDEQPWSLRHVDRDRTRLDRFRTEVSGDVVHERFTTPDNLAMNVTQALIGAKQRLDQARKFGRALPAPPTPEVPAPVPDPPVDDERPPVLHLSPRAIDFGTIWFAGPHGPRRIRVENTGGGALDWRASCNESWVTADRDDAGVLVSVRPSTGRHRATVTVAAAHGETLPVALTVHRRRAALVAVPVIVVLCIVVAAAVAVLRPTDDGAQITEVTVPGSAHWTATDVDVEPGDTIVFRADGDVVHNGATGDSAGPDGDEDDTLRQFNVPGVDGPHGALIGRLAPDAQPFVIGSELSWVAPAAGVIELGVNDADVSSNSGSFQVTLERSTVD